MVNEKTLKPLSYVVKKQLTQVFKYAFPCGKCFNCRVNQSRVWKNRILLEAKCSEKSYFITLTYNDEHLPYDGKKQQILRKDHLQKYIKRLRKSHEPYKLRYYAVGEYGSTSWRPHYHLVVFANHDITRHEIESRWSDSKGMPIGHVYIGDVSNGSASYVAGYVQKKATAPYYLNLGTRPPEFATMSRHNGGIGLGAIKEIADLYNDSGVKVTKVLDHITMGKKKLPIGRYLVKKLSTLVGVEEKAFVERYYELLDKHDAEFDMQSDSYIVDMLDKYKGKRDSQINKNLIRKAKRTI